MTSCQSPSRRGFLRQLGVGAGTLPFVSGLASLRASQAKDPMPRKRLVIMFSPNGTLPPEFWPDDFGSDRPLQLKTDAASLGSVSGASSDLERRTQQDPG